MRRQSVMLKNIINCYWVKHVSSQNLRLSMLANTMAEEEIINIGLVDVDFAANLGEGDEALIAVVLPCFGWDAEEFSRFFGFEPVAVGAASLGFLDNDVGKSVKFFMQWLPFFLGYQEHERWLCVVGIRITQWFGHILFRIWKQHTYCSRIASVCTDADGDGSIYPTLRSAASLTAMRGFGCSRITGCRRPDGHRAIDTYLYR